MVNDIHISTSRLLKMLNLQQIGRNYYNPSDPISIPNHRFGQKGYSGLGGVRGAKDDNFDTTLVVYLVIKAWI